MRAAHAVETSATSRKGTPSAKKKTRSLIGRDVRFINGAAWKSSDQSPTNHEKRVGGLGLLYTLGGLKLQGKKRTVSLLSRVREPGGVAAWGKSRKRTFDSAPTTSTRDSFQAEEGEEGKARGNDEGLCERSDRKKG